MQQGTEGGEKKKVTEGAADGCDKFIGESGGYRGRETDGEVEDGCLIGYTPRPADLCLREFYGHWFHTNYGGHLSGGIVDNMTWKT